MAFHAREDFGAFKKRATVRSIPSTSDDMAVQLHVNPHPTPLHTNNFVRLSLEFVASLGRGHHHHLFYLPHRK